MYVLQVNKREQVGAGSPKLTSLNRPGFEGPHVTYHMGTSCGQTDMTKNIAFPQTTYASGNNAWTFHGKILEHIDDLSHCVQH